MEERDPVVTRERGVGRKRAQCGKYPAAGGDCGEAVAKIGQRKTAQFAIEQPYRENDCERSDSGPGSAEPDEATALSRGRGYLSSVSSGRARIRWSMTGMTTKESHSLSASSRSAFSGSNLRVSTIVVPSSIAAW